MVYMNGGVYKYKLISDLNHYSFHQIRITFPNLLMEYIYREAYPIAKTLQNYIFMSIKNTYTIYI